MFKIHPSKKFLGSREHYDEAKIILFSAPLDHTGSFRPGARFAPTAIREASYVLEEYSLQSQQDITDIPFFDWGEVELPSGDLSTSLRLIEDVTAKILKDSKLPAIIGGEHLISYPIIKTLKGSSLFQGSDELLVFDIDAHSDLRDSFSGMKYSHATVMRRIAEVVGYRNLYQFGIRSGTKEEKGLAIQQLPLSKDGFEEALLKAGGRPIYITLDIDVVDPAFAPGVGTPEPGGITSREILEAMNIFGQVRAHKVNIVGFDLVEVSPPYDPSSITAVLGAKLIIELLFLLHKKP